MGDLIQFKKIADEITIREDGVGVVTIRGAARLTGISPESISQAFRSVRQKPNKLARTLIEEGFDGVRLATMHKEGITDEAMAVIAHYYAYDAGRYCKPEAKHTSRQFKKLGARTAFYGLKGLMPGQAPIPGVKNPDPEPKPQLDIPVPDLTPLPPASDELTWTEPTPEPPAGPEPKSEIDSVKEIFGAAMGMLEGVQIGGTAQQDKNLKTQAAIAAAQSHCPQFAAAFDPVLQLLQQAAATKVVYLTPTTLGQMLGGISGRQMNQHLAEMGLQVRNEGAAKSEPSWLPTEKGSLYSKVLPVTATNGDMTTYQCLRWSEQVLTLFRGGAAVA